MWSPVRQGPIWEAERAVWDARGQGREAERQARAARLELAEGLAASSARSEVIAARVAVLQYRLHAAATGLAGGEELLDMVEFELEAMRWLREGRDSDAEAAELRRKAAPWCRAASTASDPDVREQGARCLDFE